MEKKGFTPSPSKSGNIKKKRDAHSLEEGVMSPARDWRMIFLGFVFVNLLSIGVHTFLYYTMSTGAFFANKSETPAPAPALNQEKLNTVLDHFEKRREELRVRLVEPELVPEVE